MTPEEALAVAERIVDRAVPGEQLEAVVSWARGTEVRAHEGQVEHFVSAEEVGVGVRVLQDGRTGISWAGVLDEVALDRCIAEARDNARFGTSDPRAGLAEPDGVAARELELVDPALAEVGTADKVALALDLDRRLRAADERIVGHEGADYSDAHAVAAIASTTGLRALDEETATYLGVWALASDGLDTASGFGMDTGRGFTGLDVTAVVEEARDRCTAMLGARKAPTARVSVVLEPYVTSQLLGIVAELLNGEEVLRGRSPFAGRLGERVASPALTLYDDPLDAAAPTATSTDGEGIACRRVPLIDSGELVGFLHNAYTARCLDTSTTGSASRASHRSAPSVGPKVVTLAPGSSGRAELLGQLGEAFLVTELSGLHSGVNPTSGDLSVGAEGRMVRGGEPAEAVREVIISTTLQRMLAEVIAVGDDVRYFPWEAVGVSLAVAEVTLSGI